MFDSFSLSADADDMTRQLPVWARAGHEDGAHYNAAEAEEMRVLAGDATGRYHSPAGRLGRKVGRKA